MSAAAIPAPTPEPIPAPTPEPIPAPTAKPADGAAPTESAANPLGTKEQMIRDRFSRFQDRVFRLREELAEKEPENAQRLARAIHRASELQLREKLDRLVEMLSHESSLTEATDAQAAWLNDADRLLAVLLERDGDDQERDKQIGELERYKKEVNRLLESERRLRDQSAQTSIVQRLGKQLDQALQRLDAIDKSQKALSEETRKAAAAPQPGSVGEQPKAQEALARQTKQLAKDLENLSKLKPEERADSPAADQARGGVRQASQSLDQAGSQMQKAADALEDSKQSNAQKDQQDAQQALREARKQLEAAKKALGQQSDTAEQADQQRQVAGQTRQLSQKMRKSGGKSGGKPGGKSGKPGASPESQPPGTQNLDQAQQDMDEASESLQQDDPGDATTEQEDAIEQLEQTRQELDKALEQLRKEERAEMLRDLEARFRDMLSRQRAINATTLTLDRTGRETFGRAERLQLAELSGKERKLGEDAAACGRVLEEDGTTIVVPHVINQASEDMATVAGRLAKSFTGPLTIAMEQEIVDALEQLVDAVKQMQQENEQKGGGQPGESDENQPLLPTSAELKLLRASQLRVNSRTILIDQTQKTGADESPDQLREAFEKIKQRQSQCAEMAQEMRDRKDQR